MRHKAHRIILLRSINIFNTNPLVLSMNIFYTSVHSGFSLTISHFYFVIAFFLTDGSF